MTHYDIKEKQIKTRPRGSGVSGARRGINPVILSGVDTVGIVEKVTSGQRPEGGDRGGKVGMWERVSRWREQPVQRPWWEKVAGVLEEQQGGPCGWSRVSEAGSWDSKVRPGGTHSTPGLVGVLALALHWRAMEGL